MSKHTPGPWRVTQEYLDYCAKNTFSVAPEAIIGPSGEIVVASSEWLDLSPENARLVAAAPELLAALISTEEILEDEHWSTTKRVLRELIAKATGEQP